MFEQLLEFKYWEYVALPLAAFVFLVVGLGESGFIKKSDFGLSHYKKINASQPDATKYPFGKKILRLVVFLVALALMGYAAWKQTNADEARRESFKIQNNQSSNSY